MHKLLRRCLFLLCVFSFLRGWTFSQESNPPAAQPANESESVTTFHSSARQVLVDVVVTDKKKQFVSGLTPKDFTLTEDGKLQHIVAFSSHVALPSDKVPEAPQLPPHQYTNFTAQEPGRAVTIILLDVLNTPFLEQSYARKQMLEFLRDMPPGQMMALFTLDSDLGVMHGFTGDSTELIKSAKAVLSKNAHLITTESDLQTQEALDDMILSSIGRSPSGATGALASLQAEKQFTQETRIRATLASLQRLARSMTGYAGRKNLLWLSSDFPFRIGPSVTINRGSSNADTYVGAIEETAALMASAQIAVYPIDVHGLQTIGIGIETPSVSSDALAGTTANAMNRQIVGGWDVHESMADLARETGGQAFYGSNDFKSALLKSINQGTNYYTLAYTPEDREWKGQYRKIEVKVDRPDVQLAHRRGYYAVQEKPFDGDEAQRTLAAAMQPTVPESTMLLLRVQVLPPDKDHKKVQIGFAVDAHDIAFIDGKEKRKLATIDFMSVAWDKDLKSAGHATDRVDATLRPEAYESVMQVGFPDHQELDLKPGNYLLRLGVIDRGSRKVGTVDVPLTVPAN